MIFVEHSNHYLDYTPPPRSEVYQAALTQDEERDKLFNILKLSYSPSHAGKQKYFWLREGDTNVPVCRGAWMRIYNVSENRMSAMRKKGE